MNPVMDRIEKDFADTVTVIRPGTWSKLGQKYGVRVVPTMVLIDKDGKAVKTWVGAKSYEEMARELKGAIR